MSTVKGTRQNDEEALLKEASAQWSLLSTDAQALLSSLGQTGSSYGKALSKEVEQMQVGVPAGTALESTKKAGSAIVDWAKAQQAGNDADAAAKLDVTGKEVRASLNKLGEALGLLVKSVSAATSDSATEEAAASARSALGETGKRLAALAKLYASLVTSKQALPPGA